MKEVFISVGIPVYNAEKFLEKTIRSVLNQSYKNFELIITDDGSSDKSVDIVKSFNDSRITLIADGENRGISYRLNQQIRLAKGKYFFRMDADDLMFPERIFTQVNFLEQNPEIDRYAIGFEVTNVNDILDALGPQGKYSATSQTDLNNVLNPLPILHLLFLLWLR